MPNLSTPSLVLAALALLAGCRESPSPTAPEALRPPEIVGEEAPPGEGPPDRIGPVDGGSPLAEGAVPPLPEDPEACLDEVLQRAGLNRFGDPEGTMYAGCVNTNPAGTGRPRTLGSTTGARSS